jgi:starvation-inducible DNA-binding protein
LIKYKEAAMKKSSKDNQADSDVIEGLSCILADTYLLYLKTQNFHWNVTGPAFYPMHKMFEEQYEALAEAADVLAERLRALQARAPGSFAEFLKLSSLEEADDDTKPAAMITALCNDHETLAAAVNRMIAIALEAGDEVTADIMIARKTEHDKTAWMLRSTLEKS